MIWHWQSGYMLHNIKGKIHSEESSRKQEDVLENKARTLNNE